MSYMQNTQFVLEILINKFFQKKEVEHFFGSASNDAMGSGTQPFYFPVAAAAVGVQKSN
jgi:hypothetical protein